MSNFNNPPNERGLVMPRGLGDETDDVNNWTAFDQMLQGTHAVQNLLTTDENGDITDPTAIAALQAVPGLGGVTIVLITADTELSIAAHNGKILRLDAARTLTAPEGLGTAFSCVIEWPAGTTATIDPTGATQIQDTATPAGSTATRTRTHSNNPSGVVLKSTGTANVLSLSGS